MNRTPDNGNRMKVVCEHCKGVIVKPYPADCICSNCGEFSGNVFDASNLDKQTREPSQMEPRRQDLSERITGVNIRQDEVISTEEYINFFGITTNERTELYSSNEKYASYLEFINNLDFIATSFLDGDLDKMLLVSEENEAVEKALFLERNNIIYIILGNFSDKKGKWILQQMAITFEDLVRNKDINNLSPVEKSEIDIKFRAFLNSLHDHLDRHNILTDKVIPYVDKWLQIDYIGLSALSTGVISLPLDDENKLKIESPDESLKGDILTAKIEAIAAFTQGMTGAYPRWIAVKVKYQTYRFITLKKYKNDFILSMLSEGNLQLLETVESRIDPLLLDYLDVPFSGNLSVFNELKTKLSDFFYSIPERKFDET